MPLLFFPLIVAVFALATGGRSEVLRIAGGGILWTAAAFAALLAQEAVFRADREAGIIEQLLTSPHSLIAVALWQSRRALALYRRTFDFIVSACCFAGATSGVVDFDGGDGFGEHGV